MDEGDDWLHLALIGQLLDQPFYADLRTKQQLGYIVQSGVTESDGVRALVFSVQSSVQPPPEVERRSFAAFSAGSSSSTRSAQHRLARHAAT